MVVRRVSYKDEEEAEVDCLQLTDETSLKGLKKLSTLSDLDSNDSDRESDGTASSHSSSDTSEQLSDPLLAGDSDQGKELDCSDELRHGLHELLKADKLKQLSSEPEQSKRWSRSVLCYALLGLWILVGFVGYHLYHAKEKHVIELIQETSDAQVEAHDKLVMFERDIQKIQRSEVQLNRMNHRLKAETAAMTTSFEKVTLGKSWSDTESVRDSFIKRAEHAEGHVKQLGTLEETIQDSSRRQVLEKYGKGPYFIRFELDFSGVHAENSQRRRALDKFNTFTVLLAPLDLMPHTVHLFLEQVSRGLWDGCSFIINAGYLVKASPFPYDTKNVDEDKATRFIEAGLAAPFFPEYSDDYPHKEYTLGFVGKPDAQGFFINTNDNSVDHGRGMQPHHQNGGGDPCFGEVIFGLDAIHILENLPIVDGMFLKDSVGIKSVKIVDEKPRKTYQAPPWMH